MLTQFRKVSRLMSSRSAAQAIAPCSPSSQTRRTADPRNSMKCFLSTGVMVSFATMVLFTRPAAVQTDVAVCFYDPHSPWQRGTNEDTSGLLRQHPPRSSDPATNTETPPNQIATKMNERPQEILG